MNALLTIGSGMKSAVIEAVTIGPEAKSTPPVPPPRLHVYAFFFPAAACLAAADGAGKDRAVTGPGPTAETGTAGNRQRPAECRNKSS